MNEMASTSGDPWVSEPAVEWREAFGLIERARSAGVQPTDHVFNLALSMMDLVSGLGAVVTGQS